jgi:regulator of sigma E protease
VTLPPILAFLTTALWHVLPFLFVITVVVTIHELGHFYMARLFGVKIDAFSIGFGKTLFSHRDKSGVVWRVAMLPLGGYVKFAGDANVVGVPDANDLAHLKQEIIDAEGPGAERKYYHFKPVWQRALIALAGPLANFVLAVFLLSTAFWIVGKEVVMLGDKPAPAIVGDLVPGWPAAKAGIQTGDRIVSVDGHRIDTFENLSEYVSQRAGETLVLDVRRGTQDLRLSVVPKRVKEETPVKGATIDVGRLGFGVPKGTVERRVRTGPIEALGQGVDGVRLVLSGTVHYLARIFEGHESGNQLSGPVGIFQASGDMTRAAANVSPHFWVNVANVALEQVSLIATLSIGIGFLNLLPIPVLDGGHLLFYGYEAVARKPLKARVQEVGYQVGLALLLGLMLFATWNDLQKLPVFKNLGGLFS